MMSKLTRVMSKPGAPDDDPSWPAGPTTDDDSDGGD